MTMRLALIPLFTLCAPLGAQHLKFIGTAERFLPDLVCTPAMEVKLTFSPDGKHMLWGAVHREGGPGDSDIWESRFRDGAWTEASPAPFNTAQADFDPFFAPDGSGVYYFSGRPGGLGGTDVWFAPLEAETGVWGQPIHLSPNINSGGDEWAPILTRDGKHLIFASDGRGGEGIHDLFCSEFKDGAWQPARGLPGKINTPQEDFDGVLLENDTMLVFTRMGKDRQASYLFVSFLKDGKWREAQRLGPEVNVEGVMNFGPSFNPTEPGILYFTSKRPGDTKGGGDIYRISYRVKR